MSLPQERSTAEQVFYTWVARSRPGSSSFTASALNKLSSSSSSSSSSVLATAYWATSAQGGVTRRGVVLVLTYLLSLVIGSQ